MNTSADSYEINSCKRNDTQNRLIKVNNISNAQASVQNKLIARYGCDPLDRRIWKEQYKSADGQALAQPQRTYYLYAGEGLIAESTQAITLNADGSVSATNNSGAASNPQVTTQYGPRPDSEFTTGVLFVKTTNSNNQQSFAYLHHDHLQTPLQATDKAGNVVWAASYNAFGKAAIITPAATANNPTINLNLRLPGQYLDEETGLHYNYRRYYDTEIGRYFSQDPIGLRGGLNQYLYVRSDPINLRDPSGEIPIWAIAGGLIGGGISAYQKALDPCSSKTDVFLAGLGGATSGFLSALIPIGSATKLTSGFIGGAIARNAAGGYGLNQASNVISNFGFSKVAANHDSAVTSAFFGGVFGALGNISGLGSALLNVRGGYPKNAIPNGDRISTAVGVLGGTLDSAAQFSPPANSGCGCKQ